MLVVVGLGVIETQGGRETIRTSKSDSPGTCGGVVDGLDNAVIGVRIPRSPPSAL